MSSSLLLWVTLLLLCIATTRVLRVDSVLNRGSSVDGFLPSGEFGLLVKVTSLLDLQAELLSKGLLDVDSPCGGIYLSANLVKSTMLVFGFKGSLNPLTSFLGNLVNLHFLLFAGRGAAARITHLVALTA